MSDIYWKENAVCYANAGQWVLSEDKTMLKCARSDSFVGFEWVLNQRDFQLNEIRTGDYIAASELDTEQKYNDVVEVFGLLGIKVSVDHRGFCAGNPFWLTICNDGYAYTDAYRKRQLTYHQIIAIGKLKRMMLSIIEAESVASRESREICNEDSVIADEAIKAFHKKIKKENADQVQNPKHYQLIEGVESIEIIARSMTKEQWKGFCLGNMLKYRIRAGKKDALHQDIEKANFYGELYEMHKEKCYDQTNNKTNA